MQPLSFLAQAPGGCCVDRFTGCMYMWLERGRNTAQTWLMCECVWEVYVHCFCSPSCCNTPMQAFVCTVVAAFLCVVCSKKAAAVFALPLLQARPFLPSHQVDKSFTAAAAWLSCSLLIFGGALPMLVPTCCNQCGHCCQCACRCLVCSSTLV